MTTIIIMMLPITIISQFNHLCDIIHSIMHHIYACKYLYLNRLNLICWKLHNPFMYIIWVERTYICMHIVYSGFICSGHGQCRALYWGIVNEPPHKKKNYYTVLSKIFIFTNECKCICWIPTKKLCNNVVIERMSVLLNAQLN